MWQDKFLSDEFQNKSTIKSSSLILAEFNLNDLDNISRIGNYRYRPESSEGKFLEPIYTYDEYDIGDYYTDADISYKEYSGTDEDTIFKVQEVKESLYYSLGDCFLPFRPRSGINKARFIGGNFIDNIRSADRPRYYMPSRTDYFKYWSSYRKEDNIERGISSKTAFLNQEYLISDTSPFIVYKDPLYFNRVVIKIQTNVGDVNLGTIRTDFDTLINDPLYDYENATVPATWKIQKLNDQNNWEDIISFDKNSTRADGSQIFPKDGHLEIFYGLKIPEGYEYLFDFIDYIDDSILPESANKIGTAYVVDSSDSEAGTLKIWNGEEWESYNAEYRWSLHEQDMQKTVGVIKNPVNPILFNNTFREFDKTKGLRLVIKSMNSSNSIFDLIEMSPRLLIDMSIYSEGYDVTKTIANDNFGIPVGSLSVSSGQISLVNFDDIFTETNIFDGRLGSIVSSQSLQNTKFIFYEVIKDVSGSDKYLPIKTFYSEEFPRPSGGFSNISISLRDLFFRLETINAPSIFTTETTLTYAISQIFDYIGFTNYVFKGIDSANDPIIPYFFVEPDASVAEILNRLAVATQSAMFFDEYNNFVVMSKEYLLPEDGAREIDLTLYGNNIPLPNIISISDSETKVINDGKITYTTRYVQKDIESTEVGIVVNEDRVYKNKSVLLWEASGTEETLAINRRAGNSPSFALSAMPLNSNIDNNHPYVVNRELVNNIIDVGENIYFVTRFQGYLYSAGEIIRYDAVEFAIPGRSGEPNVWISSNQEYQKYFGNLAFGGKIYPTGRIRIYSEPYYEEISGQTYLKNGEVRVSGRAQFNTQITSHEAGLPSYWSNPSNVYGVDMDSSLIFITNEPANIPTNTEQRNVSDSVLSISRQSNLNGIIKNSLTSKSFSDGFINTLKTTSAGTIQSSALVFKGPNKNEQISNHRDLISYVYKDLSNDFSYRHFGTRMRIIGRQDINTGQSTNGSMQMYSINANDSSKTNTVQGGSGGIAIMVDPVDGSGYYFEIVALDADNIQEFAKNVNEESSDGAVISNVLFYKIKKGQNTTASERAIPQKLWGGLANIIVDSGSFAGEDRLGSEGNPTVNDLAIEYQQMPNGSIKFYLYINNNLVKIIEDKSPLEIKTNVCLFVRGSSQCMFENLYALEDLVAKDANKKILDYSEQFGQDGVQINEYLRKYAISGILQSTYLTGIGAESENRYKIFFEEFGSIMRECYFFNIKYDQAYPSFYSQIAETFSNDRMYTVSQFYGGPYEAEFLVFNAADKTIFLDDTIGNYLRIFGITFTQETTQTLSVDEYFKNVSNFSSPSYQGNEITSPQVQLEKYNKIQSSRTKYGKIDFSLENIYIQSRDQAEDLIGWIIDKTMRSRRSISVETFPMPQIQLGDLVNIEYTMPGGLEYVDRNTKFIVKQIEYSRSMEGPTQVLRLVEV